MIKISQLPTEESAPAYNETKIPDNSPKTTENNVTKPAVTEVVIDGTISAGNDTVSKSDSLDTETDQKYFSDIDQVEYNHNKTTVDKDLANDNVNPSNVTSDVTDVTSEVTSDERTNILDEDKQVDGNSTNEHVKGGEVDIPCNELKLDNGWVLINFMSFPALQGYIIMCFNYL